MLKSIIITFLTYLFAIVTFFLGSTFVLFLVLFKVPRVKAFASVSRVWAGAVLAVAGIKVEIKGIENVEFKGPKVIISNHQGNFDILILIAALPFNFRFLVKRQLFDVPFFGWYLRGRGDILVDRERGAKAAQTLKETSKLVEEGEPVLIFPEGTRSLDGAVGQFKRGSLVLAIDSCAKIVPIGIAGSYDIQKRGNFLIKPSKVYINIGEPVSLGSVPQAEVSGELAVKLRDTVVSLMTYR